MFIFLLQLICRGSVLPSGLLVLALTIPSTASAWELIPLLGYTGGGQFVDSISGDRLTVEAEESTSLIVAFDDSRDKQSELLYSYQSSYLGSDNGLISKPLFDIRFHYLHLGGNYFFNGQSGPAPYVAGGIGLTLMQPQVDNGHDQLRPSINLAFGVKWMLSDRLGLRAELRGYGTLMDNASYIACNGGCNIQLTGDLLTQFQLSSGVLFRF